MENSVNFERLCLCFLQRSKSVFMQSSSPSNSCKLCKHHCLTSCPPKCKIQSCSSMAGWHYLVLKCAMPFKNYAFQLLQHLKSRSAETSGTTVHSKREREKKNGNIMAHCLNCIMQQRNNAFYCANVHAIIKYCQYTPLSQRFEHACNTANVLFMFYFTDKT